MKIIYKYFIFIIIILLTPIQKNYFQEVSPTKNNKTVTPPTQPPKEELNEIAEEREEETAETEEEKTEEEIAPEKEEKEAETVEEEKEIETESVAGYLELIDVPKIMGILQNTIGLLSSGLTKDLSSGLEFVTKNIEQIRNDLKKGIVIIPGIGMFKFEKYVAPTKKPTLEEEKKEGAAVKIPTYVGTLYDAKGKTIKKIDAGPFKISRLQIFILSQTELPQVACDIVFFNYKATITQKSTEGGLTTFDLQFIKPFPLPTGIKRRAYIKQLTLRLSPDEKVLSTETRLFGTKTEEPSSIKLDCSQMPFTFKITSKNIPIRTISKLFPFKGIILTQATFRIIPFPLSIKATGIADLSKAKLGIKGKEAAANFTASLGAEGLIFVFSLKNVQLPLNLGTINTAQLTIGSPG